MENWPSLSIRIIGIVCIALAITGYWYTYAYYVALRGEPFDADIPNFKSVYFIMIGICLIFYTSLLVFGVQFTVLLLKYKYLFIALLVVELIYFLSIGFLWRIENQQVAASIGAASGVANGGLFFQAVTGFVLWAPVLLLWASKRLHQ